MLLLYRTVDILILSLLFVILNKVTKKKIFKNFAIILVFGTIIFWTIFWIYAIEKADQEYQRQFPENNKEADEEIIIFEQTNNNNVITVPQSPTLEQLMSGEVDIEEYKEKLKKRSIDNVILQVKEDTITRTGATFILTDKNEVFCNYGDEYIIEVKKNGKWEKQETITDGFTWQAFSMSPGSEVSEVKKDWSRFYGELENGEYRLGISVYTNKDEYVYAEFSIK